LEAPIGALWSGPGSRASTREGGLCKAVKLKDGDTATASYGALFAGELGVYRFLWAQARRGNSSIVAGYLIQQEHVHSPCARHFRGTIPNTRDAREGSEKKVVQVGWFLWVACCW